MRKQFIGAAAAMLVALPSHAAELVAVEGDVLVNRGSGFVKAVVGQEVKVGDRIMIGAAGGKAKVGYGANCTMDVTTGRVFVVLPDACRTPSFDGRMNQGPGTPDGGGGGGGGMGGNGWGGSFGGGMGGGLGGVLLGGVVVGGAVGGAIVTQQQQRNQERKIQQQIQQIQQKNPGSF